MPDTQAYTRLPVQPQAAAHLDLVTRYICANATAWTEPSTGKLMPILMTIQLGDLVDSGDRTEVVAGPLAEWVRIDAAMDNLDNCDPVVPYLVVPGNHDYAGFNYEGDSVGYNTYFGTDRWTNAGYACADPANCSGMAGDWFIGGGDTIVANSRNNVGTGSPGPSFDHPGRHRAGIIRAPNAQRFLFLGAEIAFDFPPAAPGFEGVEGDDSAWLKEVLGNYPDTPTLFFHHSMFFQEPDYPFGPEVWNSDSLTEGPPFDTGLGMEAIWNEVVVPFPQIFMAFAGHVTSSPQEDFTFSRTGAPDIAGFLRNYQTADIFGVPNSNYGGGWNIIAAFDPEADEIRVRSYRIDDTNAYADPPIDYEHTGTPAATECLMTDRQTLGERTIPFVFAQSPSIPALSAWRFGLPILAAIFVIAGLLRHQRRPA